MSKGCLRCFVVALVFMGFNVDGQEGRWTPSDVTITSQQIKLLIQDALESDNASSDRADYTGAVAFFYAAREYLPAWSQRGQLNEHAIGMLSVLGHARETGLDPDSYHSPIIDTFGGVLNGINPPTILAKLDVALTVVAIRYCSDLRYGVANPGVVSTPYRRRQARLEAATFLLDLVSSDCDFSKAFSVLEPPFNGYRRTKEILAKYLLLEREEPVTFSPLSTGNLQPGASFLGARSIAAKLRLLGDLDNGAEVDPETDTGSLVGAVQSFQRRHGLPASGVIDKHTLRALLVPLSARITQLNLALERWRWVRHDVLPVIVVNIPEFQLRSFDADHSLRLSMPVIVGKAYRHKTPIFEDQLQSIIVRPFWNVPFSIQKSEIAGAVKADPNYLTKHHFELVSRFGKPIEIDVTHLVSLLASGKVFVRQTPGEHNALGLMKFAFLNSFNIYLHGTPEQQLFSQSRRDFSHGCIRVQDPLSLALWALEDNQQWDRGRLYEAMHADHTISIAVKRPITLLIVYTTAVVEEDLKPHFFEDVYGYDRSLETEISLTSVRQTQLLAPWLQP